MPDQAIGAAARIFAVALVICAAALTPPPLEAEAGLPALTMGAAEGPPPAP